jgi:hypothetical protein
MAKKDIQLYILAWFIMLGFFGELGYLLHLVHSGTQISDTSGSVFMLMGGLNSMAGMVAMYFFGSTKGSAEKTTAMVDMAKTGTFKPEPCPPEVKKDGTPG